MTAVYPGPGFTERSRRHIRRQWAILSASIAPNTQAIGPSSHWPTPARIRRWILSPPVVCLLERHNYKTNSTKREWGPFLLLPLRLFAISVTLFCAKTGSSVQFNLTFGLPNTVTDNTGHRDERPPAAEAKPARRSRLRPPLGLGPGGAAMRASRLRGHREEGDVLRCPGVVELVFRVVGAYDEALDRLGVLGVGKMPRVVRLGFSAWRKHYMPCTPKGERTPHRASESFKKRRGHRRSLGQ